MKLAEYIDHTILRPDCTIESITKLCEEALQFSFYAVCVPPYFVSSAFRLLDDSPVKVSTVIGFPMGYSSTQAKVEEIKRAIVDGADELDVVCNICAVKSNNWNYVKSDIDAVTRIAHLRSRTVKIIFETGLLTQEEIQRLCEICRQVDVDFVKTSTGFNGAGATPELINLMKTHLPSKIKIKASGGIRTADDACRLIEAGAARIGCSSSVKIMSESIA